MTILYEDDQILVCIKPAGMKTQTGKISEKDMVSEINNYINKEAKRAGKKVCPIFLIHRLDEPVAGILVFAKTKEAASELNSQIRDDVFEKCYYAVVCGNANLIKAKEYSNNSNDTQNLNSENMYILSDYLVKDTKSNKAIISDKNNKDAKKAILEFRVVSTGTEAKGFSLYGKEYSLLDISLHTGRFHQIRCQLSHAGLPIVGDVTYGGEEITDLMQKRKGIGLLAYRLCFRHPVSKKKMEFKLDNMYLSRFEVSSLKL